MPSFTLTRPRAIAAVLLALAAVSIAARLVSSGSPPPAVSVQTPTAATPPTSPAATTLRLLIVDVGGAVRRPGVYSLRQGSRIADAVARAGGTTRSADRELINFAAPLSDGEQVLVPTRGATALPGSSATAAGSAPGSKTPVDLNAATAEQLDSLPGVGPVTTEP